MEKSTKKERREILAKCTRFWDDYGVLVDINGSEAYIPWDAFAKLQIRDQPFFNGAKDEA